MLAKALLTVFAVSAVGHDEVEQNTASTECTSVLQKKNFVSERAALAERRAELERVRDAVLDRSRSIMTEKVDTMVDAVETKIYAVDSALRHETVIDELQAMQSKLETDGYKLFPAGGAITGLAEEAVNEEIKHQKVHESLALKLEEAQVEKEADEVEKFVLRAITSEFDANIEESGEDTIKQLDDAASAADADAPSPESEAGLAEAFFAKIHTATSLESHKHVIEELEDLKSRLSIGSIKQFQGLPAESVVTNVTEEAVDEEIKHQKMHESLVEKLDKVPYSENVQDSLAWNIVLDAISNELVPRIEADADADSHEMPEDSPFFDEDSDEAAYGDDDSDDDSDTANGDAALLAKNVAEDKSDSDKTNGDTVESANNTDTVAANGLTDLMEKADPVVAKDGFEVQSEVTGGVAGTVVGLLEAVTGM